MKRNAVALPHGKRWRERPSHRQSDCAGSTPCLKGEPAIASRNYGSRQTFAPATLKAITFLEETARPAYSHRNYEEMRARVNPHITTWTPMTNYLTGQQSSALRGFACVATRPTSCFATSTQLPWRIH